MRSLFRRLAALFAVAAPTAVVVSTVVGTGVAEASCPLTCYSDRRLKKNVRPI